MITIEALENMDEGIIVGGQVVSDVRFADDQGMVASTENGLQKLMNKLNETAKTYNMKMNVQKTKAMVGERPELPTFDFADSLLNRIADWPVLPITIIADDYRL